MIEYIYGLLPAMISGLKVSMQVFVITLVTSIPLGIIVALIRNTNKGIISKLIEKYILIMRGTPLMLQIVFVFFGLPIVNLTFERLTAVLIAFILNYTAYFAEIFRGGINSVDRGQFEAAKALGMGVYATFTEIILPQAIKNVLPSIGNEVITLVKDTSLVYVVGLGDLLRAGKIASNRDVSLIPLLVVGIIYLGLTNILTKIFDKIENSYSYD